MWSSGIMGFFGCDTKKIVDGQVECEICERTIPLEEAKKVPSHNRVIYSCESCYYDAKSKASEEMKGN